MDNHKELIERLRTESLYKDKATLEIMDLCMEASDAIAALTEENARLRAAMRPNCIGCEWIHPDNGNCTIVGGFYTAVPAAHCPLIPKLRAQLEQVKRERDVAVEFLGSIVRNSTNPCEGCKADCIDAGSDDAEYTSQCGMFEWRGPQKESKHGE